MTQFSIKSSLESYDIRFRDTEGFRTLKISGNYDDNYFKVAATDKVGVCHRYEFKLSSCPVLKGLLTDLHNASLLLGPLMEQIEAGLAEQLPPARDRKTSDASTE